MPDFLWADGKGGLRSWGGNVTLLEPDPSYPRWALAATAGLAAWATLLRAAIPNLPVVTPVKQVATCLPVRPEKGFHAHRCVAVRRPRHRSDACRLMQEQRRGVGPSEIGIPPL